MKKIIIVLLITFLTTSVFAVTIKEDILNYKKAVEKHQDLIENTELEGLLRRIDNSDSQALFELIEHLQGGYLDSMEEYLQQMALIDGETIEIKFLHKEFIEANSALYNGLRAAKELDAEALKAASTNPEAEIQSEYEEFLFGYQLFKLKMETYYALNQELTFIALYTE